MENGEAITPDHIVEQWLHDGVVDITGGLPMRNAGEAGSVLLSLFKRNVPRLPILGSDDRTHMLVVPKEEKPEHKTLYDRLGLTSPDGIQYTASIELDGLPADDPPLTSWMHLDDTRYGGYVRIQSGSDFFRKPLTAEGRGVLGRLLTAIRGVTVSWG